jgi:hypothetical protein
MRSRGVALLAACVVLAAAGRAAATEPFAQVKTYAATVLTLPRGVRNIGMGSTGVADVSPSATGDFNPASFAWADAVTATVSNQGWPAAIDLLDVHVSGTFPIRADSADGPWRFGGSLGYVGLLLSPQRVRTIFLPEGTSETIDADDHCFSGSIAAAWTRGAVSLGAGTTATYARLNSGAVSAWAFDVGVIAAFPIQWEGALIRPRAGAASLNIGPSVYYDGRDADLDGEFRGGVGVDVAVPRVIVGGRAVPAVSLSAEVDVAQRSSQTDAVNGYGAEISMLDAVRFRFGEAAVGASQRERAYGLGLGWDWGSWLVQLDYAHAAPVGRGLDDFGRDAWGVVAGARW